MAPVTNIPPPVIPSKAKKPIPPGIQTNGVGSSRSSPSPSLPSAQRPKNAAKPPTPITAPSANPAVGRIPARARSGQPPGRASRNSIGLRSASLAADPASLPRHAPRPYIANKKDILKRFAGVPPSLIVHLHPNHFRFDNQDDVFQYGTPMSKMFMGHVKARTVPHELLPDLTDAKVQFYDGCLIVQLYDHKSAAQKQDVTRPVPPSKKVVSSSIHNYTPYVTPSPYGEFPKDCSIGAGSTEPPKEKTSEEIDKQNMPAPVGPPEASKSKAPPKPKVHTIVLHPTPESLNMDLQIMAITPRDGLETHIPPPTPMTGILPPTPTTSASRPAKRPKTDRMVVDATNIRDVESQILLAIVPELDLEPARSHYDVIGTLQKLEHPNHASAPPKPKTRKRTVAEMAADEHQAAEQERYMLTLDERATGNMAGGQGGGSGADESSLQGGAAGFEPRFERFKLISEIRIQHAEKKEQERQKQDERARKLAQEKQNQQLAAQQAAAAAQAKAEADAAREKQRLAQQQANREITLAARRNVEQRAAQAQQAQIQGQVQVQAQAGQNQAQQAQLQAQQNGQNAANMIQASHAHPVQTPAMANGLPNGLASGLNAQQARLQQVSQPAVSSPIVRQNTPQNMSSPMVGSVPMQASGSNMGSNMGSVMGGSPARPSSVVQNIPMGAVNMSAQGSQRSHPAGTPRQPHATPNMQQVGTPVSRPQVIQTPRMPHASPGMTPQQAHQMLLNQGAMPMGMGNPQLNAQQQAQLHQRQQQIHAQRMAMAQNGMMANGSQQHPATAQQAMHMATQQRAMLMQQQLMQQQIRGQGQQPGMQPMGQMQNPGMAMNGMQNAQIQAIQQQQHAMRQQMQMAVQAQAAQQAGQPMAMPGNPQITPAQMAMLQQMQQQQRMAGAGLSPQGQAQNQVQQMAHVQFSRLYHASLQEMVGRYGSREAIPQAEHQAALANCQARAQQMAIQALNAKRNQMMQLQHQQQAAQQAAAMQMNGGAPGMGGP